MGVSLMSSTCIHLKHLTKKRTMTSLSMVEAQLPTGFKFHPKDDELVCDYLLKWLTPGTSNNFPLLIQVDLNTCEPWDIPEVARVSGKEWYFYSQRDKKYATGARTNRATVLGYWKATGKDRPIFRQGISGVVGMRKTLVFYRGRAPRGVKTDWVMHEFRLEGRSSLNPNLIASSPNMENWVLCRVSYKKRSPPAGKQESSCENTKTHSNTMGMSNIENEQVQVPCFSFNIPNYQYHSNSIPPLQTGGSYSSQSLHNNMFGIGKYY